MDEDTNIENGRFDAGDRDIRRNIIPWVSHQFSLVSTSSDFYLLINKLTTASQ